jgi:hypothetical protein
MTEAPLEERTRSGGTATYPKVKRVYIAGVVKDWMVGTVRKRWGLEVHGVPRLMGYPFEIKFQNVPLSVHVCERRVRSLRTPGLSCRQPLIKA